MDVLSKNNQLITIKAVNEMCTLTIIICCLAMIVFCFEFYYHLLDFKMYDTSGIDNF